MNPTDQLTPTQPTIEPIQPIKKTNKLHTAIPLVAVIVLCIGIGFAVILLKQSQDNRSRASGEESLTMTVKPFADAYISSSESTANRGASSKLGVEAGSRIKISYLNFNLSRLAGAKIQNVAFGFRVGSDPAQSKDTLYAVVVPNTSWSENSITFKNNPGLSSTVLGTISGRSTNTWYSYNFSPTAVQPYAGDIFSFAVIAPSSSTDYLEMLSRENAGNEPRLEITYTYQESLPSVTTIPTDYPVNIQPIDQSNDVFTTAVNPTNPTQTTQTSSTTSQVSILNYNILLGCYSDLRPAISCSAENKSKSDLTKDGRVNQFDYNLFIRGISSVSGQ